MIWPYRLLEPKLQALRRRPYSLLDLYLFSVYMFLASVLVGALFHPLLTKPAYILLLEPSIKGVNALSQSANGLPDAAAQSLAIFAKNFTAVAATLVFARRTRGISVGALLVVNGLLIGALLTRLAVGTYSPGLLAAGFLTHGVLELAGVLLGATLGLRLLLATQENLTQCKARSLHLLGLVVAPTLFVGALIESNVTPKLLEYLGYL